jgi:hypothetical protein
MTARDGLRDLLRWLDEEIARLKLAVEALEAGNMEVRSRQDGQSMADATADSLAQAKLRVSRLQEIRSTYFREG